MSLQAIAYRARRVVTSAVEPVQVGACVSVAGDRVIAIGAPSPGASIVDLGDVILAPGLVNAHTHLELSRAPFSGGVGSFPGFLWSMKDYRPRVDEAELACAAADGAREALGAGTVAVIDLATCAPSARAVASSGLSGVVCSEVLGLLPSRADAALQQTLDILACLPGGVRGGIFLHAPYSVSTELRDRARDFARKQRLLLATHLFESREEIELLTHGTGALFAAIDAMGMARFLAAPSTIADAITCHAIEGTLLIHLASLAPDDAARLPSGAIAVLCPRSNQNLGVGPAPHEALRRAGVVLALGTDSRATVSNLDMRDEMRAACDAYGIAPVEAFAMATLGGAAAAADPSLGRIGAGDTATFMAVNDDGCADVFEALLGSGAVSSLWLGGQPWVKA